MPDEFADWYRVGATHVLCSAISASSSGFVDPWGSNWWSRRFAGMPTDWLMTARVADAHVRGDVLFEAEPTRLRD